MTTSPQPHVQDDGTAYVITVDGERAGHAAYVRRGDTVVFTHTEIDPAREGQGLGSALVRRALDDVRSRGLRVVPLCPFVKEYIARHADYADLVDP